MKMESDKKELERVRLAMEDLSHDKIEQVHHDVVALMLRSFGHIREHEGKDDYADALAMLAETMHFDSTCMWTRSAMMWPYIPHPTDQKIKLLSWDELSALKKHQEPNRYQVLLSVIALLRGGDRSDGLIKLARKTASAFKNGYARDLHEDPPDEQGSGDECACDECSADDCSDDETGATFADPAQL